MIELVVLSLPITTIDMEHVRVINVAMQHPRQVLVVHGRAKPAVNIGHVTINRGSILGVGLATTLLRLMRNHPPMPNTFQLKCDLGPAPRMNFLPRKKATWKESVYGPTNRKKWRDMQTGKSLNRS